MECQKVYVYAGKEKLKKQCSDNPVLCKPILYTGTNLRDFPAVQICCWIRFLKIITQTCTWHYGVSQAYQMYFMPMFAITKK